MELSWPPLSIVFGDESLSVQGEKIAIFFAKSESETRCKRELLTELTVTRGRSLA